MIENDGLVALVNADDRRHAVWRAVFERIAKGKLTGFRVAASAYMEYELLHRSKNIDQASIEATLRRFMALPNLGEVALSVSMLARAGALRATHRLSYFDSIHAATAAASDGVIVSSDAAYRAVPGLAARRPEDVLEADATSGAGTA